LGLLTQRDPIGIAGGLNLYGYANGDRSNFSDPFGPRAEANPCEGIEDLDEWAECKRNQYEQEDAKRESERSVSETFSIAPYKPRSHGLCPMSRLGSGLPGYELREPLKSRPLGGAIVGGVMGLLVGMVAIAQEPRMPSSSVGRASGSPRGWARSCLPRSG
jgi:hypothetical protein